MAIRAEPASPTDISALVELMGEFYFEADHSLDGAKAASSFATLAADPALGAVWVLRRDGQAAGYAVLTVRFSMEYGGTDAFIDDLFVRREHRRHGLGRCALAALIAECHRRRVLALHVEVGRDNVAANALYRSFGLRPRRDRRQRLTLALGNAGMS